MPPATSSLALHGGPKAVTANHPTHHRWGAAELARLTAMVDQSSLFYWKGPQTEALLGEFRRAYPLQWCMPCSSGTAALHIAVSALQLPPGSRHAGSRHAGLPHRASDRVLPTHFSHAP